MPLIAFEYLSVNTLVLRTMKLLMANWSIKRLVEILYDVFMRVNMFIFLIDFIVLVCDMDINLPIILGRPFLVTNRALVDVETWSLKFRVNGEEISLNIDKELRRDEDFQVNTIIDVVDEVVQDLGELAFLEVDSMAAIMLNYMEKDENYYDEVVATMIVAGSHSKNLTKLNIDLKSWEMQPTKSSIVEPTNI